MKAFWECDFATVYQADALKVLESLPDNSVDAVVTDPPYSSGGFVRSDRTNQGTSAKYTLSSTARTFPEFFGDNRDQRAFLLWCSIWLGECARVVKPGGFLLVFTDWRQLPQVSDAIQCGGWVWRGIVPWDKTEGVRPTKGWYRNQCEYVLTASNGPLGSDAVPLGDRCLPGCFRENVRPAEKQHTTGKPLPLMQRLLEVVPAGGTVFDPFAGSGTTLLAAKNLGLKSIGCELSAEYCERIKLRLSQEVLGLS